jgi:hypothetical protein
VLQLLAILVVTISFFKVARNFNAPVHAAIRSSLTSNSIYLNYVQAMNRAQEKTSAVIYDRDLSNVDSITQQVQQVPSPDARSAELRDRLLAILSKLTAAADASAPPADSGPRRSSPMDHKTIDEYAAWRKEYDVWLRDAVQTYAPSP